MLKARFVDKILEALGDEARKIKIYNNTFSINFYGEDNISNRKIASVISFLHLEDILRECKGLKVTIDYELKTLKIELEDGEVVTKNLGRYGVTGLWTMVMEILEGKNEI